MKKYIILSINVVVLIGLIVYSVDVNNRLDKIRNEYEAAYNEFKELDRRYFPKLKDVGIEIEKYQNEHEFIKFPDSIQLKLIHQIRLGSYFYDYKLHTDWVFVLVKVGLEEQLMAIRVLIIIGAASLLFNGFYIFLNEK